MLLRIVVNFVNNFQAAFALVFLGQKITNPNCNKRKTVKKNTFVQKGKYKMLIKLTPGESFYPSSGKVVLVSISSTFYV